MNVSLGVERDLSPVFETGRIELDVLAPLLEEANHAEQDGRTYAAYVHRSGERRLVYTEVEERLKGEIIPNLQADIALALAEHLRR